MLLKKEIIVLIFIINIFYPFNFMLANNGGAIAASVLGGFGAGAIIAASAKKPREVVYLQGGYSSRKRNELIQWENELLDKEEALNIKEQRLRKKAKILANKENDLNIKIKKLEAKLK